MNFIVPSSVLVPLTTGVFNFSFLTKEFRILCYYFTTSFVVNVITAILSYYQIPNLIFFHLYTPIEAAFLLLFFEQVFAGEKIVRMIRFFLFAFPLYCIINFIFFHYGTVFNTYTHSVESLMFIVLSIYYFWKQSINQEAESKWTSFPLNWIISGLLLYFSSTFFLYIFSNVLLRNYSRDTNIFIWNVHGMIILLTNVLWTVGFYKCRK